MSELPDFKDLLPMSTADKMRTTKSLKWSTGVQLPCFVAQMDFQPAPAIRQALSEWALEGDLGYQPPALLKSFQEAIADYYSDLGWQPERSHIRPVSDLVTLFEQVLDAFLPEGQPLILLTPTYMNFLTLAHDSGRPLRTVSMVRNVADNCWDIDWDGLASAMTDGGMLVLISPHNPIGKSYTREELARIAELAAKSGVRVFADEIHAPIMLGDGQHVPFAGVSPEAHKVALTAFSATKGFSIPGTKAAALIFSNPQDVSVWKPKSMRVEFGTATSGLVATAAALNHGRQWLTEACDYLRSNRDLVAELTKEYLPGAIFIPPESTYLAWLDVRGTANYEQYRANAERSLARNLANACGVLPTDGEECGPEGVGHIRVNFATHRDTVVKIFQALGSALSPR
ncbi:MalY/PatB family protein [Micrococcoides hystricis]|uniref:cysteine-S-conjugate beta-lyase n=1 Tax=Micrococcoides hystricis TaxID=1572761 RepID=A0ABV6P837_9MICC